MVQRALFTNAGSPLGFGERLVRRPGAEDGGRALPRHLDAGCCLCLNCGTFQDKCACFYTPGSDHLVIGG